MNEETQAAIDAALAAAKAADQLQAITVILVIVIVFAFLFGGAGVIIFLVLRSLSSNQQFSQESTRATMGTAQELRNEVGVMRSLQGDMIAVETVRSKSMSTLAEGMTLLTSAQTALTQAQTAVVTAIAGLTSTLADTLPALVKTVAENTEVLKKVVKGQDDMQDVFEALALVLKRLNADNKRFAEYILRPGDASKQGIEDIATGKVEDVAATAPEPVVSVTA